MNEDSDYDSHSHSHSSFGMGILAFICAFPSSWLVLNALTKSVGLALVFSVFTALIAFDYGRRSILATLTIFLASMLMITVQGFLHLFN